MRYSISIAFFAYVASVAAQLNPTANPQVYIPIRTVAKAYVADVNSNTPVSQQWDSGFITVKFAWDFNQNCYSEQWSNTFNNSSRSDDSKTQTTAPYAKSICWKTSTTYLNGKCNTAIDNSNQQSIVTSYYNNYFSVYEGQVSDPFTDSYNQFGLWRNTNKTAWLWTSADTNDIVYLQDYRADQKKTFAYYFPFGFTKNPGASSYNFLITKCQKS